MTASPCVRSPFHVWLLLLSVAVLFGSCDDCDDSECFNVGPIAILLVSSPDGEDLLNEENDAHLADFTLEALNGETEELEAIRVDDDFTRMEGTYGVVLGQVDGNLDSGISVPLASGKWALSYTRSGQSFTDTVETVALGNGGDCCVNLFTESCTYTGSSVVSSAFDGEYCRIVLQDL